VKTARRFRNNSQATRNNLRFDPDLSKSEQKNPLADTNADEPTESGRKEYPEYENYETEL
jgi:hypothetical protein